MEHPAAQAIGPDRLNENLNGLIAEFEQRLLDDGTQTWLTKPSPNDGSPLFFGDYRRRHLLGQVVAWTADMVAALVFVVGGLMIANHLKGNEATVSFVLLIVAVAVIWGIGRGFRYMLAGA